MPEDEVRRAGRHLLGDEQAQRLRVLDHGVGAALGIDHAAALGRAGRIAVADVVVAGHEVARVGEEAGEVVVAVDVLGHAVDELHDAARLEAAELRLAGGRIGALHGQRHPEDGADLAFPVGGVEGELGATGGRGKASFSTHERHPFRSSRVRAPARRTRGASPVQSSTVEAVPDAGGGTSRSAAAKRADAEGVASAQPEAMPAAATPPGR